MQQEVNAANPKTPIQILGVDYKGYDHWNPQMTAGRTIPWLQDTAQIDAWNVWMVLFHDIVILDPTGHVYILENANDQHTYLSNHPGYKALEDTLLALANSAITARPARVSLEARRSSRGPVTAYRPPAMRRAPTSPGASVGRLGLPAGRRGGGSGRPSSVGTAGAGPHELVDPRRASR